jgi:hypothetical protein
MQSSPVQEIQYGVVIDVVTVLRLLLLVEGKQDTSSGEKL